jgi:hypothetical protein
MSFLDQTFSISGRRSGGFGAGGRGPPGESRFQDQPSGQQQAGGYMFISISAMVNWARYFIGKNFARAAEQRRLALRGLIY